ncbi:hypothetical protein FRB93_007474 [Tulasnella sp. JGI-2019a]|nr:hypothetical protein FRB93_007474 [Tulasnella sp. JGI-2019a]
MSSARQSAPIPNPLPLELTSFSGGDGEDVTIFVRDVKRIAIAQGHQRDQEWIVDYVESCLDGQAMRWFSKQDPDGPIMSSWHTLRQGLLDRFTEPPSRFIPQPAPAAALPRAQALRPSPAAAITDTPPVTRTLSRQPPMAHTVPSQPVKMGRIKLHWTRKGDVCYIYWLAEPEKLSYPHLSYTTEVVEALIVEKHMCSRDPSRSFLKIVETAKTSSTDTFLGVIDCGEHHDSSIRWYLDICTENRRSGLVEGISPGYQSKVASKDIWSADEEHIWIEWVETTTYSVWSC